jgi:hypothetical protein
MKGGINSPFTELTLTHISPMSIVSIDYWVKEAEQIPLSPKGVDAESGRGMAYKPRQKINSDIFGREDPAPTINTESKENEKCGRTHGSAPTVFLNSGRCG